MSNSLPLCQPGGPPGRVWRAEGPSWGWHSCGVLGASYHSSQLCVLLGLHTQLPLSWCTVIPRARGSRELCRPGLARCFTWLNWPTAGLMLTSWPKLTLSGWRFNNLTGIRKLFHLMESQVWENNWRVVLGGGITWERIGRKGSEEAVSYYQFVTFFFNWKTQWSHVC